MQSSTMMILEALEIHVKKYNTVGFIGLTVEPIKKNPGERICELWREFLRHNCRQN